MSKTKFLTIIVIILFVINVITLSFFLINNQRKLFRDHRPQAPSEVIIDRLHFDENQIGQYEKLIEAHQSEINSFDKKINSVKNELYLQLSKPDDKNLTDSLLTVLLATQKQIEVTHLNHFKEVKSICKPNQIEDFNNLSKDLSGLFRPKKRDIEREKRE
jgi:periplasmic protein CpxP/Spy